MQSVIDHRRANFRRLVEQLGGPREASIQLDMNESQISQLISDSIGKTMGHRLARKIEHAAGMPVGVLDMATSIDGRNMVPVPVITEADLKNCAMIAKGEWPDENSGRRYVVWDNSNPYQPIGPLVAMYLPDDALAGLANEGDLAIFDCWPRVKGRPERVKIGCVVTLIEGDNLLARVIKQSPQGGYDFISTSNLYAPIHRDDATGILGVLVEVRWLRPRLQN